MQLSPSDRAWARVLRGSLAVCLLVLPLGARADGGGDVAIAGTLFHEGGGPLNMTVITPSVRARVDPIEEWGFSLGWDADVVSGASVAVVDAPSPEPDVISTATQLDDFRNVFSAGTELRSEYGTIRAGYSYGFENDYRSHSVSLGARAEAFERTAVFDFNWARGWDSVCDELQADANMFVERRRLSSSMRCFSDDADFSTHDVSLETFQGSWTQAWARILATQLTVSAQLVEGFQSNPYRAVWLGRTAAQEHHPNERARYAASLSVRLWLEPLSSALQLMGRIYRDTWDVQSVTAELGYELVIDGALRVRARGRYYTQTGAAFFSDDYSLMPMGQYFTGDRELSAMSTITVGASFGYAVHAGSTGPVLGFMEELDILLKGDWVHSDFPQFHYGLAGVPNVDAVIGTLSLEAHF